MSCSVSKTEVERVFPESLAEADGIEKKYVPLFKRKSGTKWNEPPLLLCTARLFCFHLREGREDFFGPISARL